MMAEIETAQSGELGGFGEHSAGQRNFEDTTPIPISLQQFATARALQHPPGLSELGLAALEYAALGLPVFPCRPGEKRPLIAGWPEKATTDAAQVRSWWSDRPDANVAVATGPASGFFVLDVDDEGSLIALEREHGSLPGLYPQSWTGRGWQAFFRCPGGRTIRNSAGKLGPGLDTRGQGGYVVLPPSIHPSGKRYEWATDRDVRELPPEPPPAWLVDLLDPPAPAPMPLRREPPPAMDSRLARYVAAAIQDELERVATAAEGARNSALNQAAFALGQFAGGDLIPEAWAAEKLEQAGLAAGLPAAEARATIRSGLGAGRLNPREVANV